MKRGELFRDDSRGEQWLIPENDLDRLQTDLSQGNTTYFEKSEWFGVDFQNILCCTGAWVLVQEHDSTVRVRFTNAQRRYILQRIQQHLAEK